MKPIVMSLIKQVLFLTFLTTLTVSCKKEENNNSLDIGRFSGTYQTTATYCSRGLSIDSSGNVHPWSNSYPISIDTVYIDKIADDTLRLSFFYAPNSYGADVSLMPDSLSNNINQYYFYGYGFPYSEYCSVRFEKNDMDSISIVYYVRQRSSSSIYYTISGRKM